VAEAGDGLADALSTAESAYPDAKSIVIALDVAPAPADGAGALAIRALPAASGLTFAAFYDAVLTRDVDRTVTDIGSGNDALIGVSYPFDFSGRSVVRVFACHAGSAYEIAAAPNEYGEHVVLDRAAGTVTVYAKRYSTYGIGYTEASSPSASAATTRKAGPREGLCETRAATEPHESLRKAAIRQYERRAVRLMRGRSGALTA